MVIATLDGGGFNTVSSSYSLINDPLLVWVNNKGIAGTETT